MPHCHALKSDLLRCNHYVLNEGDLCGTHANTQARRIRQSGLHQAGKCEAYLTTNRWCPHNVLPNDRLCAHHNAIRTNNERRINEDNEDRQLVTALRNEMPRPTWQEVMDRMFADITRTAQRKYNVAFRFFTRVEEDGFIPSFTNRWDWIAQGRIGPEPLEIPVGVIEPVAPPAPRTREAQLRVIANDRQNVHTTAVSNQTNAGLEKILNVCVPENQDTQRIMTDEWLFKMPSGKGATFNTYLRVINDVNHWFMTKTCRATNDALYRNVLRGTVALIKQCPKDLQKELFIRLWEECLESVDMCCEGHITRLCNVFVGFDDEFKPSVPFGEILQNKMSAIANSDLDEEEKIRQANAFFDEYAVPQLERLAWLEAF